MKNVNVKGGTMIIEALRLRYESQIAEAKANIQVYIDNPAGIGEHPDLVAAVDHQMSALADAQDKLESLIQIYGDELDD